MKTFERNYLFLVVLGGRAVKANIELHDVRWVVGSKIEDTFDVLRKNWFGIIDGLHIDSFKKIEYIDGYKIELKNNASNHRLVNKTNLPKLWFINIGGYEPTSMQEKHEFGLVVASSKLEAKKIAQSKWLIGCKKKHRDDIKMLISFDNCQLIKNIDNWEIELTPANNLIKSNFYPDWYGYKKIESQ